MEKHGKGTSIYINFNTHLLWKQQTIYTVFIHPSRVTFEVAADQQQADQPFFIAPKAPRVSLPGANLNHSREFGCLKIDENAMKMQWKCHENEETYTYGQSNLAFDWGKNWGSNPELGHPTCRQTRLLSDRPRHGSIRQLCVSNMWHDPTENEGLEHARTQQQVCLLTENMPISADCTHSALYIQLDHGLVLKTMVTWVPFYKRNHMKPATLWDS